MHSLHLTSSGRALSTLSAQLHSSDAGTFHSSSLAGPLPSLSSITYILPPRHYEWITCPQACYNNSTHSAWPYTRVLHNSNDEANTVTTTSLTSSLSLPPSSSS